MGDDRSKEVEEQEDLPEAEIQEEKGKQIQDEVTSPLYHVSQKRCPTPLKNMAQPLMKSL